MKHFQRAWEINPNLDSKRDILHYNLGLALKQKDALNEAIAELRRAATLDPSLYEAHYALGVILLQQSKLDDAAAEFRAAVAVKKDYAEAHYALGTVLQQKENLDGAISAFREALKFAPNAPEIHNTLGNALRQKGDIEAARVEFQEAARLNKIKSNQQRRFSPRILVWPNERSKLDAAVEIQAAVQLDPQRAGLLQSRGTPKGQTTLPQRHIKSQRTDPRSNFAVVVLV